VVQEADHHHRRRGCGIACPPTSEELLWKMKRRRGSAEEGEEAKEEGETKEKKGESWPLRVDTCAAVHGGGWTPRAVRLLSPPTRVLCIYCHFLRGTQHQATPHRVTHHRLQSVADVEGEHYWRRLCPVLHVLHLCSSLLLRA